MPPQPRPQPQPTLRSAVRRAGSLIRKGEPGTPSPRRGGGGARDGAPSVGAAPDADGAAEDAVQTRSWPAPAGLDDVADRPESVVVILTTGEVRGLVRGWLEFFADTEVHVVSAETRDEWELGRLGARHTVGDSLNQLNTVLKSVGPIDVIIDLRPGTVTDRREIFHRLFLYLRPGGRWVVDRTGNGSVLGSVDFAAWVQNLIGSGDPDAPAVSARDKEFARSIASIRISPDLLMLEKQGLHYVKLRDAETVQVLGSREPGMSVEILDRRAGGTLTNRARVVSHGATVPIVALDDTMTYPALQTRRYRGRMAVVSNALVHTDSTVLPESFRHHLESSPRNPRLTSISATFGRISESFRPRRTLPGSYYHLDAENSGHFGHLMTEVISRLWGWDAAKAADPDLKALFRIRFPNERDPALERTLFGAYGIAAEDIVWIDAPVWVEDLVGATPMWHNQFPHYVHPGLSEVWRRLGDALVDESAPTYPKLFVSRRELLVNRACRNTREVEAYFAERGFTVVYPEEWSLQQQAGMFAHAEVIAGFGGSALFNVMFADRLKTLIVLNHEAYTARNEHLFTALMDIDVHYFWSTPDVPHPVGKWSEAAYYSSWDFDFERNGPDLADLLARL